MYLIKQQQLHSELRVSPLSGRHDSIYDLHDAVQGGVGTYGHVSAAEVIVDGAHQPHDVQVAVLLRHRVCDPSWRDVFFFFFSILT